MGKSIVLRDEYKEFEHRSAITPQTAKALIDAGYRIRVERSKGRIFKDEEYESVGAELVKRWYWRDEATQDEVIVGLKELPDDMGKGIPRHTYVHFGHMFKGQSGWEKELTKFAESQARLLDLEYLTHSNGRRVAAFGYYAGFAGAGLALLAWLCARRTGESLANIHTFTKGKGYFERANDLVNLIKLELEKDVPRVMIMGAKGRCGSGAVELCRQIGLPEENILQWDIEETKQGGPFNEITQHDIYIHCILLQEKMAPFLTKEMLTEQENRRLSVICDVSADSTNPNNPIPVYTETTTFERPVIQVGGIGGGRVDVISIDHLPSLVPREASEQFAKDLLPYLRTLDAWERDQVWKRANDIFESKLKLLRKAE